MRALVSAGVASRGRSRQTVIGAGVVVCVAVAVVLGATRFDEVLGLFDFRADQNASLGYLDRLYADGGVAGSQRVVEDALALMPEDATYRVVVGPHMTGVAPFTRVAAEDFLEYYLLPRRRVESGSTPWVFCYGCDVSTLGPSFRVLSDGANGVLFGRDGT